MSGKSDAATTTEDIKMAPLCLFYFSHPFGILSPNPPSVTMAPEDYLPPSWMSSAFSEKSWIPISFPIKKIDVSSTTEEDNTEYKMNFAKQSMRQNYPDDVESNKKHTKSYQRQKKLNGESKKLPFEPFKNSKLNIQRTNVGLLPPIEKVNKIEKKIEPIQSWPNNDVNKFRRKSLLPPIDMRCLLSRKDSASESSRCESKNHQEDMSDPCDEPAPRKVKVKRKMRSTKRIRPIRSSRGVNKGRCLPNRSAARKLVACLLQNASKGHRATTASLPSLGEVLKTVRQAWASPKSLLPREKGETLDSRPCDEAKSTNMGLGQPLLPGASPGLLRRRYSLPETVMRKYKLAQQKSDSEDSETGSAHSVWIPNPIRDRGSRGRERGPKSVLLRRLWGREPPPIGGSHSELRYWDSHSGSSSPRSPDRTCEACKKLSDKSLSNIGKSETYKTFLNRSPKKQPFKCMNSANHSPERYIVENGKSPSTLLANSTTSDRSSFKSASVSEGSPKLGLSSLVTSSYPATETISTCEMTRSSASYSSDETSRSQSNPILMRPSTGKSSPLHKKRRQSASSYTTSEFDTKDSNQTTADTGDKETTQTNTSERDTTTSETITTTTTTTSTTTDTSTKKDTSTSRSDSAMSTHTENSTDYNKTTDNTSSTDTSTTPYSDNKHDTQNINKHADRQVLELSDTGISSEAFDCESGKNTESLKNEDSISKEGSVTFSEDYSADVITCVEKPIMKQNIECLEVVVSETLNSLAFENKNLVKKEELSTKDDNKNDLFESQSSSRNTNRLDIDQYVSNILIDSLNTMTDQINEINSNIDDDRKLNILEKEIKVKLQSVGASPINIITNPIITTLITSIPDKELLETTIIEEKMRSLAYTTESKLFPMESTVEIETRSLPKHSSSSQEEDANCEDPTVSETKEMSQTNNNCYDEGQETDLYLNTDTPLPYDVNENESGVSVPFEDAKTKAVLRQLHRMFENSSEDSLKAMHSNVDDNFNLCDDDAPKAYFCGTTNDNTSHLEMSTDVDVFVDNSLNKMMNSIDINYNNGDLDDDNKLENLNVDPNVNNREDKLNIPELRLKDNTNMLSNIGTGSAYEKPPRRPLVVPRFSAIPHSESMEVNTSTDDETQECQSDCMSLVDSLDDPNSPRFMYLNEQKALKKLNKHDKKLVRGDIMTLLPENSSVATEHRSPREKSETFFIPIKENSMEVIKENIVVAEHMPEKIKEKLYQRQQKREMRKEYYKRKRLKQLKKELQRQKRVDGDNADDKDKDQSEKNSPPAELINKEKSENKKKTETSKTKAANAETEKKNKTTTNEKKTSVKSERLLKKEETLKNIEAFIIDKQGNYQTKKPATKKAPDKKERALKAQNLNDRIEDIKLDDAYLYRKNETNNTVEAVDSVKVLKTKIEPKNERLNGPRRLYQKTEFQEGNKHVEILEIVECIESSPEPSDESQESLSSEGRRQSNSKIPVLQKKSIHRSNRGSRSPIGKNIPMNITVAKNDRDHKSTNSKTDQLIANILIDALNTDDLENSNVQLIASPRDKKAAVIQNKPTQVVSRRISVPQQSTPSTVTPKYRRKFDVIPEEKSSMSIESSNEDVSMNFHNTRRSSVPIEAKRNHVKSLESPKGSPKKTKPLKTIDENSKDNSPKKTASPKNQDVSTSPIPRYASTATSPIPLSKLDETLSKNHESSNHIKGKKALGTREGWAGFCRPQTRYSPENEGSHPSSNNPSDREAVGKIVNEKTQSEQAVVAPPSQKILRTTDGRDNVSPPRDSPKSTQKSPDNQKTPDESDRSKRSTKKHKRDKPALNGNENKPDRKSAEKNSRENSHSKSLMLPSPFKNQSFTQSSDMSTSSGSDSEAGINCPVLVPRWPPINAPRYRRTYPRRQPRQEEGFKMPHQNISGGWSVTLAGSCYTTLPSDVEMKVCFPKNAPQHTTSQSDSGLGEEQNYRKQTSNGPMMCKKCQNCENLICQNCKSAQNCKCNTIIDKNQTDDNMDSENQIFLPPTHQMRKSSKLESDAALNSKDASKKYYHYLPDLNSPHGLKNKKKPTLKMARRFSLHCWLPEDKLTERTDVAKLEITETIAPLNYDELSVYGCAIMPEIKPRVPTMSERDLTRVHTAQHYSRHRHI